MYATIIIIICIVTYKIKVENHIIIKPLCYVIHSESKTVKLKVINK